MDPHAFAPAQQAHTSVVRSDSSLSVTITDADGLHGRFLRELNACGFWQQKLPNGKRKFGGTDALILDTLCVFIRAENVTAQGEPYMWPSQKTIQLRTGLGRAIVHRRLKVLEAAGVFSVHSRGLGAERTIYILHFATTALTGNRLAASSTEDKAAELRAKLGQPSPADGGGGYATPVAHGGARQDTTVCYGRAQPVLPARATVARAGSPPSATGVDHRVLPARATRATTVDDTLRESSAAVAAAALERAAATAGEELREGTQADFSPERRQAVDLLVAQGIPEPDAVDVLSDPNIRIVDDHLCAIIHRIRPGRPPRNPGGWWRVALRKHGYYGVDPAKKAIAVARERPVEKELDHYEAAGKKIVDAMTEDEVRMTAGKLIEYYRRADKKEAARRLEYMPEPANNPDFWRAVGKNQQVVGGNQ